MGKRILVPVDRSEQAKEASAFVVSEFGSEDTEMVLLHVINPTEAGYSAQASIPSFSEEWFEREKEAAQNLFDDLEAEATAHGITVSHEIEVGKPTRSIVEFAEENDVDQIVMGSHGRAGVTRILLGSVAEAVVRRSPVPVTVVR
ncbi:universal stress protein [Haloarculaceae archaeon H-GB2-1]|nr:universal stress protein [Haloarculaceae archaeon H-GB1-1]MEA5387858.1 universal stress protein [Haloarculaceae archaeon H-GB11]MEA5409356.1 universal stress protein [Haloarculaceae archaeon H-GB2-1]